MNIAFLIPHRSVIGLTMICPLHALYHERSALTDCATGHYSRSKIIHEVQEARHPLCKPQSRFAFTHTLRVSIRKVGFDETLNVNAEMDIEC